MKEELLMGYPLRFKEEREEIFLEKENQPEDSFK